MACSAHAKEGGQLWTPIPALGGQFSTPIHIIFNEGLARVAADYLTKGAKVLIEGKLATKKWQDQNGNDRYTTEIQVQPYTGMLTFLDSKKRDGERTSGEGNGGEDQVPF